MAKDGTHGFIMVKTFNLEEKRLKKEIIKKGARRVLIQLPEGLKANAQRLASVVEKARATAIISADPCYGACDLALFEAENLGVDLIVHYGHSEMIKQGRTPTIYVVARAKIDAKEVISKAKPLLNSWKTIGLVTTIQHVHILDKIEKLLKNMGKEVLIGNPRGQVMYAGQVTGCNYASASKISRDVDGFLFIGGGRLHGIGVALATAKPVVISDPFEKRAYAVDNDVKKILKQRWASILKAREEKSFGVIIGLKSGQEKLSKAFEVKKKLDKSGRKTTLLALREITPEALMQFPNINAFINTACPCVAIYNASNFLKPVLNVNEALVMLGEMNWEELYCGGWFTN